jgi:hypothetical protein
MREREKGVVIGNGGGIDGSYNRGRDWGRDRGRVEREILGDRGGDIS